MGWLCCLRHCQPPRRRILYRWHRLQFNLVLFDPVPNCQCGANAEVRDITFYDEPGTLVIGAHFNSSDGVDRSFDGLISIARWYVPTGLLQPLLDLPDPAPFNIVASAGTPGKMELNVLSYFSLIYDFEYNIKPTMRIGRPKDPLFQGPME